MSRKLIASLLKKKYRDRLGLFLVEGVRFTSEIPENVIIEFYGCSKGFLESNNFSFRKGVKVFSYDDEVFKKLSDTVNPQGVLAVCRQMVYKPEDYIVNLENNAFFVLENLNDPGNLGTIIRSAAASGIKAVFLTQGTVDVYNPKVLRATMGAVFKVPVIKIDLAFITTMKEKGVKIIGTKAVGCLPYYNIDIAGNVAIIIGNEANGITPGLLALCDRLITIPIISKADSLNAAVAASVIMFEILRQKGGNINKKSDNNINDYQ